MFEVYTISVVIGEASVSSDKTTAFWSSLISNTQYRYASLLTTFFSQIQNK